MTTKEKIEVMQAYLDGKTIQIKYMNRNDWDGAIEFNLNDKSESDWNWVSFSYRVKPENIYPKVIPATLAELAVIDKYCWFKYQTTPFAMEFQVMPKDLVVKKEGIQIFNPTTKCWEDWSK
jgi:hypothetical protein